jgi:hypothetical protein
VRHNAERDFKGGKNLVGLQHGRLAARPPASDAKHVKGVEAVISTLPLGLFFDEVDETRAVEVLSLREISHLRTS